MASPTCWTRNGAERHSNQTEQFTMCFVVDEIDRWEQPSLVLVGQTRRCKSHEK